MATQFPVCLHTNKYTGKLTYRDCEPLTCGAVVCWGFADKRPGGTVINQCPKIEECAKRICHPKGLIKLTRKARKIRERIDARLLEDL